MYYITKLNDEQAEEIYNHLLSYQSDDVERIAAKIFDESIELLPNYWRDKKHLRLVFNTFIRLAQEKDVLEFMHIIQNGKVENADLTLDEMDIFTDHMIMLQESMNLYDLFNTLDKTSSTEQDRIVS